MIDSRSYDVVVIGGGVIGLCAAKFLADAGAAVAVLDQGEFGHGSSLHNAGYVSPSHFVPLAAPGVFTQGLKWMLNPTSPLYIKPRLNLDLMRWSLAFARACDARRVQRAMPVLRDLMLESKALFEQWAAAGLSFELTSRGLTLLFVSPRGRGVCEHERDLAGELGIEARLLDQQGLRTMDPEVDFRAEGGLYFPGDAHLVPAKLIEALIGAVRSKRAELFARTPVREFRFSGASIASVETAVGSFTAKDFILAGGAWSPLIARKAGVSILMQAGTGYSVTVRKPLPAMRLPYILQERRVATTPFADGIRFAGTMEIAGIRSTITMPRVEAILEALPHYFGNIPRLHPSDGEVWSGMRPVTPDGLPYVGRFHDRPNLIAATGHAMLGVTLAAVTGRIVRDIVQGRDPGHDMTLLDPDRSH